MTDGLLTFAIRRCPACPDDRRGAVVAITARGTELIKAAAPQHLSDVRSAFIDQLTAAELATLTAIADKVRARLEKLQPST